VVPDGVIVHLRNTLGARKVRVPRDADMFATYTRLASALYEPPPATIEAPPMTTYETSGATAISESTSAWHVRGGVGVLGDSSASMLLVGYRLGSNETIGDFSLRWMNSSEADRTATSFRGQILRFTRPDAMSSLYWGGGASYASADYEMSSSSGWQLEATAGLEWNRDEPWHYSIETNVSIPLFAVEDRYPASFAISFGIAH
jgi:hypothetical protein